MNRRPSSSSRDYDSFSPRRAARFTAASPDTHFFDVARRRTALARRLFGLMALLLFAVAAGNALVNAFPRVAREEVPVRGLTEAFDGYTLLHVSDLKGALFGAGQSRLRMALGDARFDAVCVTGDMLSAHGNAEPFYALIELLRELRPDAPVYFIAGDSDPEPLSMDYAGGGSPFAPWVLGAKQRGASLLGAPVSVERGEQRLWLTTLSQLTLDLNAMQRRYEQRYLDALDGGDENAVELAEYNLSTLEATRTARGQMRDGDAYVALSHVPPTEDELAAEPRVNLALCGHYLGGLTRLPFVGALFIPSLSLGRYGLFPGVRAMCGLTYSGRTAVYVSPGLGFEDAHYPPFFLRLFNPPAVTLVTLRASSM